MSKRLFEALDIMNQNDDINKTAHVGVCPSVIRADKVKAGTQVVMGAPESAVFDLMHGKVIAMLLLIDKDEYEKVKNS